MYFTPFQFTIVLSYRAHTLIGKSHTEPRPAFLYSWIVLLLLREANEVDRFIRFHADLDIYSDHQKRKVTSSFSLKISIK